jgi:uncharacterized membrane protein
MENKKIYWLIGLIAIAVLALGFVSAQPEIASMEVYLNGHAVTSEVFSVERGDMLGVKVLFQVSDTSEVGEVKVKAWIDGYRKTIEASTERFDVFPGRLYSKTLSLSLPADMEEGEYTLHVMITGKESLLGDSYKEITLAVQRTSYKAEILSVDLALPAVVNAGETLVANVVVKNRGSHKLEDIYVRASIPELGLARNIYIGDIYPNDYADNTERDTKSINIGFVIPKEVASGKYTLVVKAENEDTVAEKQAEFEVKGKITTEQTAQTTDAIALSVATDRKTIEAGKADSFTIVLTNLKDKPLMVELDVVGVSGWATAELPSVITLNPKEGKVISLNLKVAESALAGSHVFSIKASADTTTITKNLVAEVTRAAEAQAKKASSIGFWIAIIVLAAIAVALLIALIVVAAKKASVEEEKPEEIYY